MIDRILDILNILAWGAIYVAALLFAGAIIASGIKPLWLDYRYGARPGRWRASMQRLLLAAVIDGLIVLCALAWLYVSGAWTP